MEAKDDDFSAIAWPGFVDILSTVIMMFLFFVMIVSIVMYVMSMDYKKKVEAESEGKVKSQVASELQKYLEKIDSGEITLQEIKDVAKVKEKTVTLTNENVQLKHELKNADSAIDQIKADMSAGLNQELVMEDGYFVILFEHNDISVSPETEKAVENYLETVVGKDNLAAGKVEVSILSGDNPNAPTISVSRELGLARMLNIRNIFLNKKISADKVAVTYSEAKAVKESYNWIKIKAVRSE